MSTDLTKRTPDNPLPPPGQEIDTDETLDLLDQLNIPDPKAKKAMARLIQRWRDRAPVNLDTFKDCVLVGRHAHINGMLDLTRGAGLELIRKLIQKIEAQEDYWKKNFRNLKERRQGAKDFIGLQSCATKDLELIHTVLKMLLQAEGTMAHLPEPNPNEAPTAASFAPGQQVTPPKSGTVVIAQHAHFPQPQPSQQPPTDEQDKK